jgi:hypothetical protein
MDRERVDARLSNRAGEVVQRRLGVLLVDADAALDRHRHRNGGLHRRHALAHQLRLRHEAGAEASLLHAVGGTADVEVHLVIAEIPQDPSGLGEVGRVGAAELRCDRMLLGREPEQPLPVAMNDGAGRHHFGVETCPPRQDAMEEPAMPVRPVHHRSDGEGKAFHNASF